MSKRSTLAREAVDICTAGRYVAPNGRTVEIGAALRGAIDQTILYTAEQPPLTPQRSARCDTRISVTDETTLAAVRRLAGETGGQLACLNFASAKNPGGGFLGGAEAQEESLARSSGLYPCLLAAPEYYRRNRAFRSTLYLDQVIWSPGVPFFRDDTGALLERPVYASVLTAPAPNAGAVAANEPSRLDEVEPTLRRRGALVLQVAAAHGVQRLVLGAWGCGVFRNDPPVVARVFRDLLSSDEFAGRFDQVIFAIFDRSPGQRVLRSFH